MDNNRNRTIKNIGNGLLFFVKQVLFWLLLFAFARILFFIVNYNLFATENINFWEYLATIPNALKLDLSTSCYFSIITFLLFSVYQFSQKKIFQKINTIFQSVLIAIYFLATVSEFGLYPEWKTKLNYKALLHLKHPEEMFFTASLSTIIFLFSIGIASIILFIFTYKKLFSTFPKLKRPNILSSIITTPLLAFFLFFGIRGGLGPIPISQSASYFSHKDILNKAATNNIFNLAVSISENIGFRENPCIYYNEEFAKNRIDKLFSANCDSTEYILTTTKPNIALIILESWSADLIESYGAKPGITPQFAKLEEKGLRFDSIFASGFRSEQAMGSIFGGFPATPFVSLTVQPDKYQNMTGLPEYLENGGYSTSFYFGGELSYANIKSFILSSGFDDVYDIFDMPKSTPQGRLGIHDEYMLDIFAESLNNQKQPFFSAIFTVSTHSPYDQPMEDVIEWGGRHKPYLNSAYYTDKCLGDFFEKVKDEPWYKNTLFILVADHSHVSYKESSLYTPDYHRIPLLFYGDVLKKEYQGKSINTIGSQTDIGATLMAQLKLPNAPLGRSRNILNPCTKEFSYWETYTGISWLTKNGWFYLDHRNTIFKEYNLNPEMRDSIIIDGKSFLQESIEDYMRR